MSHYRTLFNKKHTLFVVIHVEDSKGALENVKIAQDVGADGIFLIDHITSDNPSALTRMFKYIKEQYPKFPIGLNYLGLTPSEAFHEMPKDASFLWTDDAGIREDGPTDTACAFWDMLQDSGWDGLYFGGVAFKYVDEKADPSKVSKEAVPYMDVITTSGPGTGIAPDPAKIAAMRSKIGNHLLAIASGITPLNVHRYMSNADVFLVSTGISRSVTELDPYLVEKLVEIINK